MLLFLTYSSHAQQNNSGKLETWLKELKLDYIKLEDGWFKIPFDVEGEITMIFVSENYIIQDNPSSYYIFVSTLVTSVPDNFVHPLPMLKTIAILNSKLTFGNISIDEKTGYVYYSSTMWMNPATSDNLIGNLYLAHFAKMNAKKELKPFIDE